MESRAQFLGHSVHQMLVTFPIGAFGLSVVCDALETSTKQRKYAQASTLALEFGLATALLAVPFGYVDYRAIRTGTRAKRVGLLHALGNLTMVGLFAASRVLRRTGGITPAARWLSGAGFVLSGVGAWLGGELIARHAIGVHDITGQDAPSSLGKAPKTLSKAPLTQGAVSW
jgi:uncharacterized membrane protein